MPNPFAKVSGTVAEDEAPKSAAAKGATSAPVADTAAKRSSVDPRAGRGSKQLGKAPTSFANITDYAGELLAVYPLEYQEVTGVTARNGDDLAGVVVDFLVCSGEEAGTEFKDALVLGKVLVSSLKRKIDEAVILKIGQGEAKKGQNAPWVAVETTDEEDAHVAKVVASVYG